MSARTPLQKSTGVVGDISRFGSEWRRRQDAFRDRVLDSRFGPAVSLVLMATMLALGLFLLFNTLEALSTGVIHGRRGGRTYLSDAPALFWTQFVWNLALGALPVGLVVLGLWTRFGTVRGRRNAAQSRRRAKRKLSTNG